MYFILFLLLIVIYVQLFSCGVIVDNSIFNNRNIIIVFIILHKHCKLTLSITDINLFTYINLRFQVKILYSWSTKEFFLQPSVKIGLLLLTETSAKNIIKSEVNSNHFK